MSTGNPFERLRQSYAETASRCSSCGSGTDSSDWRVRTSGARIRYEHNCRSCGAADRRDLRL
ncbi:HVO_0649 family zinc finger protein [Halovivax gelatinilyticus]|uniref:HVO_0649 family zinc finger protein n=1 Tax=Halovivax gelatinilyticus TaxID=2961597 RepID=UPI00272EAABD|nr:HVO_0649 family zinc finger protein [Halovivax gelatinilyticus]